MFLNENMIYFEWMFKKAKWRRFIVIKASICVIWKNEGGGILHFKHLRLSIWYSRNKPEFELISKVL